MVPSIVDGAWLAEHRDTVVLADVRFYLEGGDTREAYDAGHLPGAVYVDLDRWLSDAATPQDGRHPFPSPEKFAEGMGTLGIGDTTPVVAYDDAGGVIAARLVWMLRAIGHDAALLDLAWPPAALVTDEPAIQPATFTPRAWPTNRLADANAAASPPAGTVVIDARPTGRYRGEPDGIDPRYGHIPGARSVPTRDHLDTTGHVDPIPSLRQRFEAAGITTRTPVISYCGAGVTACHNLLILEHAGLGTHRLYPGSWSQWSNDPSRPIATGDEA